MNITPIVDLDLPYFVEGKQRGSVMLERGIPAPVTILRRYRGMLDAVLEDEPDRIEVRQVPVSRVQIH